MKRCVHRGLSVASSQPPPLWSLKAFDTSSIYNRFTPSLQSCTSTNVFCLCSAFKEELRKDKTLQKTSTPSPQQLDTQQKTQSQCRSAAACWLSVSETRKQRHFNPLLFSFCSPYNPQAHPPAPPSQVHWQDLSLQIPPWGTLSFISPHYLTPSPHRSPSLCPPHFLSQHQICGLL